MNDGSSDMVIRNNTITGSGLTSSGLGIELWGKCDNSIVEDNTLDHWISIDGCDGVAVRRNSISEKSGSNFMYAGLEAIAANTIWTDNIVDEGQQLGIAISQQSRYQYFGYNSIKNMQQWGMQLESDNSGTEMYFFKNIFESTLANASGIYPGADGTAIRLYQYNGPLNNIVFDENTIKDNQRYGIQFAGTIDQISVINNTFTGNVVSVNSYPGVDLEWSGNTVTGNGTDTQLSSIGFSNQKPVADFNAPLTGYVGQVISFANTSYDDDGTVAHVLWDFNDSIPTTALSPTHIYNAPGTYRITLIAWDNLGRASIKEQNIVIGLTSSVLSFSAGKNIFSMYPNPAGNNVTISVSDDLITQLKITNVVGQVIYINSGVIKDNVINTTDWQQGLYFVEISGRDSGSMGVEPLIIVAK